MKFKISYDQFDSQLLNRYWNDIFYSKWWSDGPFTKKSEE